MRQVVHWFWLLLTSDNLSDFALRVNAPDSVRMSWIGGPIKDKSCRKKGQEEKREVEKS